jgi:hypothetical protein
VFTIQTFNKSTNKIYWIIQIIRNFP